MDQSSATAEHATKKKLGATQQSPATTVLHRQNPVEQKLALATQNQIALHCAHQYLSENKINQLQEVIFGADKKHTILQQYDQQFPKVKLAASAIQCE